MVKLNRKRLVVLADQLYIYDISNMKLLHSIDSSIQFALSPGPESLIAYTNHSNSILLFDSINLEHLGVISPHQTNVSIMSFNHDGTLLATASDRGTVIRVSKVPTGEILHQFRRGTYPAKISSMEFDVLSNVLAVGSDSDTIHVFRLTPPTIPKPKSIFTSVTSKAAPFLPSSFSDLWDPERDWCRAKIPKGEKCLVAPMEGQLLVVTDQGYFYQFTMDLEKGGELVPSKTFSYVCVHPSSVD
jgi:autophagy-related protein 18